MNRLICIILIAAISITCCVIPFTAFASELPAGPSRSEDFDTSTILGLQNIGWIMQGSPVIANADITDTVALKLIGGSGVLIPLTDAYGDVMTLGNLSIDLSVRATADTVTLPVQIAKNECDFKTLICFNSLGNIDGGGAANVVTAGKYNADTWYKVSIRLSLEEKSFTTAVYSEADALVAETTGKFAQQASYIRIANDTAAQSAYVDDISISYAPFGTNNIGASVQSDDKGNICYDECGAVSITVKNPFDVDVAASLGWTIKDSNGEIVAEMSPEAITIKAESIYVKRFVPNIDKNSTYKLTANLSGEFGDITADVLDITLMDSALVRNDDVGISTHFAFGNREQPEESFGQLTSGGFGWIRDEIYWNYGDKGDGNYSIPADAQKAINYAKENNIKVLAIIDSTNPLYDNGEFPTSDTAVEAYGKYCGWVAEQLKGTVDTFEIWNEPNIAAFTGEKSISGTDYVKLLKTAKKYIDNANPDATVLGGALTSMTYSEKHTETGELRTGQEFLQEILDAGGAKYMDAFSFHPYTLKHIPSDEDWQLTFYGHLDTASDMFDAAGAKDMPIWVTEYGKAGSSDWTDIEWRDEFQAMTIARTLVQARAYDRLERLFIYNYKGKGTDTTNTEHTFGIVDYDYYPKDAYVAVAYANRLLDGAVFDNNHIQTFENNDRLYNTYSIYSFENSDKNKKIHAVWGGALYSGDWYPSYTGTYVDITAVTGEGTSYVTGENSAGIYITDGWEASLYDMYGNYIQKLGSAPYRVEDETVYVVATPKAVEITAEGSMLTIKGYTEPKSEMTCVVRATDTDAYAYVCQLSADADGFYSTNAKLDAAGSYAVYVYDGTVTEGEAVTGGYGVSYRIYQGESEIKNLGQIDNTKDINVKITVKTTEDSPQKLVAYGAVYSAGEVMTSIKTTEINWVDDKNGTAELTISANSEGQLNQLRLMLWNNNLMPVCGALRWER